MLDNLVCLARINSNKTKYMEGEKTMESSNLCTPSEIAEKIERDQQKVHKEVETMFNNLNNSMTNQDLSCLPVHYC